MADNLEGSPDNNYADKFSKSPSYNNPLDNNHLDKNTTIETRLTNVEDKIDELIQYLQFNYRRDDNVTSDILPIIHPLYRKFFNNFLLKPELRGKTKIDTLRKNGGRKYSNKHKNFKRKNKTMKKK